MEAHEEWSILLLASLDGELDAAEQSRLEAHLADCPRCLGELKVQRAVRARLAREPLVRASNKLRLQVQRITDTAAEQSSLSPPASRREAGALAKSRLRAGLLAWGGWAVAAALALVLVWPQAPRQTANDIPMVADALADYRQHATQTLAAPVATPAQLMQTVLGWSTPPLPLRDARLISAWQTLIGGAPAVALAYRRGNHVIVQYIVSEAVFFRQPGVREAVATDGIFHVADGAESVIAKPGPDGGYLLVGAPLALTLAL